jgi:CIC family chloride channel protein
MDLLHIADTAEFRYIKKWSLISLLIGVISGVGSIVFFELLNLGTRLFLGEGAGFFLPEAGTTVQEVLNWTPPTNPLLIVLIVTLGGLASGWVVFSFAPEAEGHGTDAAIRSFHRERGRMRRRVPLVKMVSSVLTISTGGSAGREGPIAQIAAGFGSFIGDLFKLTEHDRRIALAVGVGSGIGSIFKAPLGGALLSTEILYRGDSEREALIPSVIASIVGYSIFGFYDGFAPVFSAQAYSWKLSQIPLYMLLGVACAGVGLLYIKAFYGTRALFSRLKVKNHYKPAIGALSVGLLSLVLMGVFPQAGGAAGLGGLGMGYGFIQLALYNALPLKTMFILIFAKIGMTSLTIGSGGSGGVFAPGLVIGAMVGGTLGLAFSRFFPALVPSETVPAFVIIGMVALFGGVSKAPIAVLLMVSEMTGDYSLLFPAMVAIVGSYILTGDYTIYQEQVATRLQSPAHVEEYFTSLLTVPTVERVMRKEIPSIRSDDTLKEAILKMKHGVTEVPIVEEGEIKGIVSLRDILEVSIDKWNESKVSEVIHRDYFTISKDKSLYDAIMFMKEKDIETLLIVDRDNPKKVVGLLQEKDIVRIMERRVY